VPVPLPPFSEAYHQVKASIKDLSEDLWAMLGDAILPQQQEAIDLTVETHSHSNPAMVSNDVENIIAKTVQAIQQGPARPKELTVKEQELVDTAVNVATCYHLLFASVSPAEDGLTMEVILPDVKTDFMTNLKKTRPISASTDLKELLNTILEIAANSDKAIDNMVQFHEAVFSVVFSNCVCSFHWLA
jgi:choline dehydrogenase-like flavoprotein